MNPHRTSYEPVPPSTPIQDPEAPFPREELTLRNIVASFFTALLLLMVPAIGLWAVYLQHGGAPW